MKQNYHQAEEMVKLCLRYGVKLLKCAGVISLEKPDPFSLSDEEKLELIQKIGSLQEKYRGHLNFLMTSGFIQGPNLVSLAEGNLNFCSILNADRIAIDYDGGMIFCCDIYQECKNKPLIGEIGFEKSFKITLDVINEIRKKRLSDLLNNPEKTASLCDHCNQHIEECLDLARKKY